MLVYFAVVYFSSTLVSLLFPQFSSFNVAEHWLKETCGPDEPASLLLWDPQRTWPGSGRSSQGAPVPYYFWELCRSLQECVGEILQLCSFCTGSGICSGPDLQWKMQPNSWSTLLSLGTAQVFAGVWGRDSSTLPLPLWLWDLRRAWSDGGRPSQIASNALLSLQNHDCAWVQVTLFCLIMTALFSML